MRGELLVRLVVRLVVVAGLVSWPAVPLVAIPILAPTALSQWPFLSVERGKATPEASTDVDAFLKNLEVVASPFRRNDTLNPLRGINVVPLMRVLDSELDATNASASPFTGEFRLALFALYADCERCPPKPSSTFAAISVWANTPGAVLSRYGQHVEDDQAGAMYLAPRSTGTLGGFPEYEARDTRIVIINVSARPLWLPVTYERVLRNDLRKAKESSMSTQEQLGGSTAYQQWLAAREQRKKEREDALGQLVQTMPDQAVQFRAQMKQLEEADAQLGEQLEANEASEIASRGQISGALQAAVDSAEAQLKSFPAEQLAAPVYLDASGVRLPPLTGAKTDGALALVAPNHDFLNAKLPRSALQLLVVEQNRSKDVTFGPYLNRRIEQVRASLDWGQLARAVRK